MRFNKICKELAANVLGKPGTLVEHMIDGVARGTYKVVDKLDLHSKECINIKDYGLYAANRFRKVIEE